MTKENVLSIFKEVLVKSGMEEVVRVSDNVNELADIMIYRDPEALEYLAVYGRPLFPFEEIRNILYKFGEGGLYHNAGTKVQFVIKLCGDNSYVLEYGSNGLCETMCFHDEWLTDDEIIKKALAQYNSAALKGKNIDGLVSVAVDAINRGEIITEEELRVVAEEAYCYLIDNPADKEFMFYCAHESLDELVSDNPGVFGKDFIDKIFRKIVKENYSEEFIDYIERCLNHSDEGYYIMIVSEAYKIIRKIQNKKNVL